MGTLLPFPCDMSNGGFCQKLTFNVNLAGIP
jgi:hypothetical protein